jgi:hypothetical protein
MKKLLNFFDEIGTRKKETIPCDKEKDVAQCFSTGSSPDAL